MLYYNGFSQFLTACLFVSIADSPAWLPPQAVGDGMGPPVTAAGIGYLLGGTPPAGQARRGVLGTPHQPRHGRHAPSLHSW